MGIVIVSDVSLELEMGLDEDLVEHIQVMAFNTSSSFASRTSSIRLKHVALGSERDPGQASREARDVVVLDLSM
jgi:hypothetical protein